MHLTLVAMVLPLLVAATPPSPAPDAGSGNETRAKILALAYLDTHDVPTAAELRALSPLPDALLISVVEDKTANGLVRSRAAAALRLFPSPTVQRFLGKLVERLAKTQDATDRLILRRAAVALGWMAAPNAPALLALVFENDDAEVRLDAAIGLGLTRTLDAANLLKKQLEVESSPRVRDQLERQLNALMQILPMPEPVPTPAKPKGVPMRSSF